MLMMRLSWKRWRASALRNIISFSFRQLRDTEPWAWPYEKGHIDHEMLKRYLVGLKGPVYYVAGPSGMVTAMTSLLNSAGVSEDDMKTEEFGDYKCPKMLSSAAQATADHHSDFRL